MEIKNKKKFKLNKKKYIILLSLLVVFVGIAICGFWIRYKYYTTLPESHVFVCDNPSNDSEFDTWMKEKIGLNWVPTYLIIKDDVVIGTIRGGIPEKQFTSELTYILMKNWQIEELPDIPVSCVDGTRDSLKNILPNDKNFYIIEISWVQCPDCIFQDENFTKDIYGKYSNQLIYRYYIHSTQDEVLEKHNFRKE